MKRLIVLAAFAVAACSSSHGSSNPTPASRNDAFVQQVRHYLPGWSKRLILRAGHTVCGNIRHGEDFQLILIEFTGAGISVRNGGYVMGVAVHTFCPQYNQRLLNSAGG